MEKIWDGLNKLNYFVVGNLKTDIASFVKNNKCFQNLQTVFKKISDRGLGSVLKEKISENFTQENALKVRKFVLNALAVIATAVALAIITSAMVATGASIFSNAALYLGVDSVALLFFAAASGGILGGIMITAFVIKFIIDRELKTIIDRELKTISQSLKGDTTDQKLKTELRFFRSVKNIENRHRAFIYSIMAFIILAGGLMLNASLPVILIAETILMLPLAVEARAIA